jgi:hypothetical protein
MKYTVKLQWVQNSTPSYHEVSSKKAAKDLIKKHKGYYIARIMDKDE